MAERKVETELTLKDSVSEALEHIHKGFEGIHDRVREAGSEMTGMFRNAASMALGIGIAGGISGIVDSFKEMASEVVHSAAELEEQEKAVRGVLMTTDKAGESFETMTARAHEFHEQLEDIGVATGASADQLTGMFDELAERTGLSAEQTLKLTEQMAQAGRAVRGGPEALSFGFANLASGIVRARNPIVQLIAATGELHGNARSVAQQMQKMSPQHAMQLGIDAIERMGAKMKGVPLSFNELVGSLKAMREQLYETVGAPMLGALRGPFEKMRSWLTEHREAIQRWATTVGEKLGEWITEAAEKFQEGFQYLQDHAEDIKGAAVAAWGYAREVFDYLRSHAQDIKDAIVTGFRYAKEVFDFIVAHKELVAGLLVAKETGLGGAALTVGKGIYAAGAAEAAPGALAAAGMGTAAVAAAAAAVGAWALAAYQAIQLWKETDGFKTDGQRNYAAMADAMMREGADYNQIADRMQEQFGVTSEAMRGMGDEAKAAAQKLNEAIETLRAEAETAADIKKRSEERSYDIGLGAVAAASLLPLNLPKAAEKVQEHIKAPPVIDMRGSTFNIQQDFRDQDPDRVIIAFKNAVTRNSISRITAATQAPGTAF